MSLSEDIISLTSCCSGGERLLLVEEEIGEEGKEEVGVSRRASPGGPNSNMSSSEERGAEKLDQSNGAEASNKKKEINDK